jgi:hypothetical protein
MAKRSSIFGDEWRRCLREHYKYVIRIQDRETELSLLPILQRFGFREEDLRNLYLEATMHMDDLPEDFVPDLQRLNALSVQGDDRTFTVHPAECSCPACADQVLEIGHDEDGQPIEEDEEDTPPDDLPRQKSLF